MNDSRGSVMGSEALSLVHRVTERAMKVLEAKPIWGNPMGRLAVHVAVERTVLFMTRDGERDEDRLCREALLCVRSATAG